LIQCGGEKDTISKTAGRQQEALAPQCGDWKNMNADMGGPAFIKGSQNAPGNSPLRAIATPIARHPRVASILNRLTKVLRLSVSSSVREGSQKYTQMYHKSTLRFCALRFNSAILKKNGRAHIKTRHKSTLRFSPCGFRLGICIKTAKIVMLAVSK